MEGRFIIFHPYLFPFFICEMGLLRIVHVLIGIEGRCEKLDGLFCVFLKRSDKIELVLFFFSPVLSFGAAC